MGDDGSGAPARESFFNSAHPSPRTASELAGQQLLEAGVDVKVVRLPQVHDTVRQGLLTCYIERAVANGAVALRGEGSNRWSAAHVDDVARLYVSALLQGAAGERYHAVAEEGIALRDIAAVIAHGLNLPLTHRMSRRSTPGSAGLRRLPPLTCAPARHGPASACSGSRLAPGCWRTCRIWTIIK